MQTFVKSSPLLIMAVAIYPKVLDSEPCRIRKAFGFTHHGIRRISKKVCESTLVSKLPRMDSQSFFAARLKKIGSYRARTCDPLLVRQMLSQLS